MTDTVETKVHKPANDQFKVFGYDIEVTSLDNNGQADTFYFRKPSHIQHYESTGQIAIDRHPFNGTLEDYKRITGQTQNQY